MKNMRKEKQKEKKNNLNKLDVIRNTLHYEYR